MTLTERPSGVVALIDAHCADALKVIAAAVAASVNT